MNFDNLMGFAAIMACLLAVALLGFWAAFMVILLKAIEQQRKDEKRQNIELKKARGVRGE